MSSPILITGANGQLGWELARTCPAGAEVHAFGSGELDITDKNAVDERVASLKPGWIINAAAYTAVDKAESEPERAYAVNERGPGYLSEAARRVDARLVQISTDFVFNGEQGRPLRPDDAADPLNVYGESKLAGERSVQELLGEQAVIFRTAWVHSSHGQNFVKTMLRLMREREQLGVVADQIGSPTWARGLARAVWRAIELELSGIQHWTDAGVASWYDFACAIHDEARDLDLLSRDVKIAPITTAAYPTPAKRPAYSVLDKTATWADLGVEPVHWRHHLRAMLIELRNQA